MQHRTLGRSQTTIPMISFGAGPVSGLMVGEDRSRQLETIQHAVDSGIDYFDTAATYGNGRSESCLGAALETLRLSDRVRIATKVRLMPEHLDDIGLAVQNSFESSCDRLGVKRVMLLQLHNSITRNRGDLPTSLSVQDVLGRRGVVAELETLRKEGRVEHFGFTGLGDMHSLSTVVKDGPFVASQIPLNILLPFAGADAAAGSIDVDYPALARLCHHHGIGVIAIRVLAGGALAGQKPSPHTHQTRFFPLDLFQRDRNRAAKLAQLLPEYTSCVAASIRYVTGNLNATTALIGFSSPTQIDESLAASADGELEDSFMELIRKFSTSGATDA